MMILISEVMCIIGTEREIQEWLTAPKGGIGLWWQFTEKGQWEKWQLGNLAAENGATSTRFFIYLAALRLDKMTMTYK